MHLLATIVDLVRDPKQIGVSLQRELETRKDLVDLSMRHVELFHNGCSLSLIHI